MMKQSTSRNIKLAATAAILLATAGAQADIVIKATVGGTAAGIEKNPTAGQYEIDYQSSKARVVEPDGSITIFDFNTSDATVLNAKSQTYSVTTIAKLLAGVSTSSVQLVARAAGKTQTLADYSATEFYLEPEPMASDPQDAPTTRRVMPGPIPDDTSSIMDFSGVAWLTPAGTNLPSAAPFAWISAPPSMAASLSNKLDAKTAAPLLSTISYVSPLTGKTIGLTMTVNSVEITTLDATTTQIPTNYKLATTTG
jgi:hypothetical protein